MNAHNIFQELDDCQSCPAISIIDDENKEEVDNHLRAKHPGIGATAFVVAKRPGEEREKLQETYELARDFLDHDFHSRFLSEFDNLSWELAAFKHLNDSGIEIHPKEREEGPDFNTEIGYIECICIGQGSGDNAVPLPQASVYKDGKFVPEIFMQSVPVDAIKLRVGHAFYTKQQVFKGYTAKSWFEADKPRIIAINWFGDGSNWMTGRKKTQLDPAIQAIFGFGNTELAIDPIKKKVIEQRLAHVPTLSKKSGKEVDIGFFIRNISEDVNRIDGVILDGEWPGSLNTTYARSANNPMSNIKFDVERLVSCKRSVALIDKKSGIIKLTDI